VDGRVLHFYLAGINNQNFLMRDKETGTWWQQITGKAIYGPLKGASLVLVLSDEMTFGEWKSEFSDGKVLAEVPKYAKEYDSNWEPETAKYPVVISFPGTALKSRDVVVGLEMAGPGRAYPWDALVKQSPVVDQVQGTPLLVVVGPDGKSFRAFVSRIDGKDAEFFLKADPQTENRSETPGAATTDNKTETKAEPIPQTVTETVAETKTSTSATAKPVVAAESKPAASTESKIADPKPDAATAPKPAQPVKPWILLDTTTASEWNFQGCAISGPSLSSPRPQRLLVRLAQLPPRHNDLQTLARVAPASRRLSRGRLAPDPYCAPAFFRSLRRSSPLTQTDSHPRFARKSPAQERRAGEDIPTADRGGDTNDSE
jgi:hypothetical protein